MDFKLALTPFSWIRAAREGLCQGPAAARHPCGNAVVDQQEQHHADDEADGPWGFGEIR